MRAHRRGLAALLVALGCVLGGAARAEAQADTQTDMDEDARLHFELGQRAYDRGDFTGAATEFAEAYALSRRPALLYNMYVAYRDSSQRSEARDALRRYLAEASDIPNRARLEETLRQLDADLTARPAAATTAGTATPSRASTGPSVPAGALALMGVGAALGVAAGVTGGLALGSNDELTFVCPGDICPETARPIRDEVETLSLVTDVLWPIAAVAVAAGLVWLIVELASGSSGDTPVACGPSGCGARWEGLF